MGRKTWLMTPDPYHIPGYCGYCPQFKYQIGQTFGGHTHNLLTSRNVASSGRSVLARTEPPDSELLEQDTYFCQPTESPFYASRGQSAPIEYMTWRDDRKLMASMVPGYTGVIPKGQHYFGCRYALASRHAIDEFQRNQQLQYQQMEEMRRTTELQRNPIERAKMTTAQYTTPLIPINPYPEPYTSQYERVKKCESVYRLPKGHPEKRFMSGYTGFLPKARKYMGQGYPIISEKALDEHCTEQARLEKLSLGPVEADLLPITGFADSKQHKPGALLYPVDTGLVPRYTGHIPSHRFSYGVPFGQSTHNALATLPRV